MFNRTIWQLKVMNVKILALVVLLVLVMAYNIYDLYCNPEVRVITTGDEEYACENTDHACLRISDGLISVYLEKLDDVIYVQRLGYSEDSYGPVLWRDDGSFHYEVLEDYSELPTLQYRLDKYSLVDVMQYSCSAHNMLRLRFNENLAHRYCTDRSKSVSIVLDVNMSKII